MTFCGDEFLTFLYNIVLYFFYGVAEIFRKTCFKDDVQLLCKQTLCVHFDLLRKYDELSAQGWRQEFPDTGAKFPDWGAKLGSHGHPPPKFLFKRESVREIFVKMQFYWLIINLSISQRPSQDRISIF